MPSSPQIVLASTSPRRIELLTRAGLAPKVVAPGSDEEMLPRESPRAMVARLARDKAEAVAVKVLAGVASAAAGDGKDGWIILAADTTVVAPDGKTVLGKPVNEADARKMLGKLSGKAHTVLTGYCILRLAPAKGHFKSHVLVRVVKSRVKMRRLSREDIARYVRTGEPMDKAGSYGAQGIGMALIESIGGSYSNVVGLPIAQVLMDLESRFGVTWLKG
jgi:septum formation protein